MQNTDGSLRRKVWYKKAEKQKDRNKMDIRWERGIWLGHTRDSNETVIGTPEGAIRAYAVKRMPEDERWDKATIEGMHGTPQQPDPSRKGIRVSFS